MKKYYTLLIHEDNRWTPEFGDYGRECVAAERDDWCEGYRGVKKKDTKIIATSDKQADIDAAVAKLNA